MHASLWGSLPFLSTLGRPFCLNLSACLFSRVRLSAIPWTVAYQDRLLCPWNFPGRNTGVGCHFLLQRDLSHPGIQPTSSASVSCIGRKILYLMSHLGNPAEMTDLHQILISGSFHRKRVKAGRVASKLEITFPSLLATCMAV